MKLILNALIVIGLWESTGDRMILEKPAKWLKRNIGETAVKPLFDCPMCMASVWGVAYYYLSEIRLLRPLFYVLSLCGLMKLIMTAINPKNS